MNKKKSEQILPVIILIFGLIPFLYVMLWIVIFNMNDNQSDSVAQLEKFFPFSITPQTATKFLMVICVISIIANYLLSRKFNFRIKQISQAISILNAILFFLFIFWLM